MSRGHHLLTVDQYVAYRGTLHPSQLSVVTANIAAGNAVSMCSCGIVLLALERHMVNSRYVAHLKASQKPRTLRSE